MARLRNIYLKGPSWTENLDHYKGDQPINWIHGVPIMKEYRLIWFQHLHKVAGTTIVELADVNGEKLYPGHKNGNPLDENGKWIKLWDLKGSDLTEFIDKCEREGITFVATEWGSPDFKALSEDPRVVLITCIRKPWDRFKSNYQYDLFKGFTKKKDVYSYSNSNDVSSFNYYTMIFSRRRFEHVQGQGLTNKDLDFAKKNLSRFNIITVLENEGSIDELTKGLGWSKKVSKSDLSREKVPLLVRFVSMITGWEDEPGKKKKTLKNPYLAVEILKRPDIPLFLEYLRPSRLDFGENFRREFKEKNTMDQALYQYAIDTSLDQKSSN